MNISEVGITLIKKYEGLRLTAYKCPAGVMTIGYGHTKDVKAGQVINQETADRYLREDLAVHEKNVRKYNNIYSWNQNEFDALTSFSFNIGNINQLTQNGTRSKKVIAERILEYNKAAGRVLSGLVSRRKEEHDLFLRPLDNPISFLPTTKRGDSGLYVTKIQLHLNNMGIYRGDIDGKFGKLTEEAVKILQESVNIKVDGIVGPVTWQFIS